MAAAVAGAVSTLVAASDAVTCSAAHEQLTDTLQALLAASRAEPGVLHGAECYSTLCAAAESLIALLPPPPPPQAQDARPGRGQVGEVLQALTRVWRLLRNAGAGQEAVADVLEGSRVVAIATAQLGALRGTVARLASAPPTSTTDAGLAAATSAARATVQCLGNSISSCPALRAEVWRVAVPEVCALAARVADPGLGDAAQMVLYNSVAWDHAALTELCSDPARFEAGLLPVLSGVADGQVSDWARLLLREVASQDLVPACFERLAGWAMGKGELGAEDRHVLEMTHKIVLLQVAETALGGADGGAPDAGPGAAAPQPRPSPPPPQQEDMQAWPRTLKMLSEKFQQLTYLARDQPWWQTPGSRPVAMQLATLVRVLGSLAKAREVRDALPMPGLVVEAAMALLREMTEWTGVSESRPAHADGDSAPDAATGRDLTVGVRRDILRLFANLSHDHKLVQDEICRLEGVPLFLTCCAPDDDNPYMREWAVLAVRNVCTNNENGQRALASISARPSGVVQSEALDEAGLEVVLDRVTGQPRVRSKPSPDPGA